MVDWNRKFRSEYDAARAALAPAREFEPGWQAVAEQLALLMGPDGFDAGRDEALAELRRKAGVGAGGVDKTLLRAAGARGDEGAAVPADVRRRVASLKLLRHVYLQNRSGNRRVWIVALPTAFTNWPSRQLVDEPGLRPLLASRDEHFSEEQRRLLATATQQGLAWCQKAGIVLASASMPWRTDAGRDEGRAMVKRWFAEPGLGESALDQLIGTLARGFKDIVAMLNRGHFVITDWVPFRASSDADESDFLATEAFAFRARSEGMDVVYVENAFFDEIAGNVLRGQANWTRILVHELSHLVCGTHDVNNGQSRYAWCGIGPHAGYPHGDAIRNADNWAFFAADCAGALTQGQRETALRKT